MQKQKLKLTLHLQTLMNMDLLTEKQKVRRNRDYKVAAEFQAMREKYPDAAATRIMTNMAERHFAGLGSIYGIRTSLMRAGVKF